MRKEELLNGGHILEFPTRKLGDSNDAFQNSHITLDTALFDGDSLPDNVLLQQESGIMFAHQTELPRLPIPSLEDTMSKFLTTLEALQTNSQKLHARSIMLEFINGGDGPKLQEYLLQYEAEGVASGELGSYIEEFWNESCLVPEHLANPYDPSSPASTSMTMKKFNPFFVIPDDHYQYHSNHHPSKDPMISRGASLCFAAIKLASSVRLETLLPDVFKEKPLCMDQYKAVFGAARVPTMDGDDIDVYPYSNHVVVMCRNQMFYFQAMWPDGTVAVDEEDVFEILMAISKSAKAEIIMDHHRYNVSEVNGEGRGVSVTGPGVLTSLNRLEWAKLRKQLSTIPKNEQYLTIIDSGLFVLVLDCDANPETTDEVASNMLHGTYVQTIEDFEEDTDDDSDDSESDYSEESNSRHQQPQELQQPVGTCCNRWYDKMQIIVCANGKAGMNFEHSAIDGHTALRIASEIYAETVVTFAQSVAKAIPAFWKIPHIIEAPLDRAEMRLNDHHQAELDVSPKRISLRIPESMKSQLFHAEIHLGDEIMATETRVLDFMNYGKHLITSNSMSPDGYVQMSIMLAYYKIYGKMVCVYEPVLTKSFFHGRTEAMRSATMPAKDLCQAFFDDAAPISLKQSALRRAIQYHSRLTHQAALGLGVDRHLYALKCIAEQYDLPIPKFFKSEPWQMLNNTILSTSNCGNPALCMFGFGPVVPNGYGIGYIIKDNSIHYCVTSKKRQTQRFVRALNGVLQEMASLLKRRSLVRQRRTPKPTVQRSFNSNDEELNNNNNHNHNGMWGEGEDEGEEVVQVQQKQQPKPIPRKKDLCNSQGEQQGSPVSSRNRNTPMRGKKKDVGIPTTAAAAAIPGAILEMDTFKPASPKEIPLKGPGTSDFLPKKPARRGSNGSGRRYSRRASLTMSQLSESGESLEAQEEAQKTQQQNNSITFDESLCGSFV